MTTAKAARTIKVWSATVWDTDMGCLQFWAPTKAESIKQAKAFVGEDRARRNLGDAFCFEVELSPEGVARFLNSHAGTDNG